MSVAQARVILVDSTTEPGCQFILDWSKDADKVVLEDKWVGLSIAAGRALLKVDEWGGCLADDWKRSSSESLIQACPSFSSEPKGPSLSPPVAPSSGFSIFTSKSGVPLSFFVQVDLTDRLSLVTMIKVGVSILASPSTISHQSDNFLQKNKGTIVSDIATANYVILNSPRKHDFPNLFASRLSAGGVALRAAFVRDCITEGALLDASNYSFSEPAVRKGKRRKNPTE